MALNIQDSFSGYAKTTMKTKETLLHLWKTLCVLKIRNLAQSILCNIFSRFSYGLNTFSLQRIECFKVKIIELSVTFIVIKNLRNIKLRFTRVSTNQIF